MSYIETPKERRKRLIKFSKKLNGNLAKSERWFLQIYGRFRHPGDLINKPFQNQYIPDVTNHRYKYVIEVDGSIHNLAHIKRHDQIKNEFYKLHGYRIFRVKPFDKPAFYEFIKQMYIIRDIPYITKALNKRKQFNKY